MSASIPVSMPGDLLEDIRAAARKTHLSQEDVIRQSVQLGLPKLVEGFNRESGRVTNVDPLPDEVLERIYANRDEEDEEGVKRFMAAQSFGGED